jgi:prolyl-tRNA synthetase
LILDLYADFAENWMAMPVLKGYKSASEKFAGAEDTYCIEALMQDGKALQAGTSHFLGQNFAKAFDVKFLSRENQLEYVWASSWGVSTRLMGALIMSHSDDHGVVLPPKLAPIQVVIVPIFRNEQEAEAVNSYAAPVIEQLKALGIRVRYDNRDTHKPGYKFTEHEFRGVPLRFAIGPKDVQNGTVEVARRDTLTKELVPVERAVAETSELLDVIQDSLFQRALKFRQENTRSVDSYEEFKTVLDEHGGFILAHWDGTSETEELIKTETKATIRLIPLDRTEESGLCMVTGKPSAGRVVFARAY